MNQVVHTPLHNGWFAQDWYKSKTLLLVSIPAVIAVLQKGISEHWPWYQYVIGVALAIAPSTLRDTFMRGVNILAAYQSAFSQTVNNQIESAGTDITRAMGETENNTRLRHRYLIETIENHIVVPGNSKDAQSDAAKSINIIPKASTRKALAKTVAKLSETINKPEGSKES